MERTDLGRGDDPLIGRVLDGRYEVGQKIARGGMATVYQARDLRLDRTVAVKVMHSGLADDPEFVSRFEREARSAARLSHHNVVSVFDQGDDRGTLFLVMEYVPGLTLRDLIRKDAPMDPGKALELIEPVLAALAAAHGAGMIHRDVKPENVLLADDGRIKVADFGLARAVNAETQHTATGGVLIGTVSYLSPELVVDGKADARSDVYAVGVLLYEMLTGVKPHQADSPIQVAYKHVHEDVPAPSLREPALPAYVDALVARATARDRDLRPSDARVLLHQVRRVRQALDHGVVEDPELYADLMPGVRPIAEDTGEVTGELEREDRISILGADDVYDQDREVTTAMPPSGVATAVPPRPPQNLAHNQPPRVVPPPVVADEPRRFQQPKRSRRGLFLLIGVLVTALLVGISAWQLGRYTTTPSVISLSQSAAKAKITKAGLTFKLGKAEYSEKYTKGSVMDTDPAPGDKVSKGGTVTVILSLGPERHAVPTVRGKTLEEVQQLIADADLSLGEVTQAYSDLVDEGMVVTTDPKAGTLLKRDTAIDVVVSKGPKPIDITDWTGKSAKQAQKSLEKQGFKVTVDEQFDDTITKGKVISQTPNTGQGVKGDEITLVVSKGPELFAIPHVRGLRTNDARQKLEDAGFKVKVHHSSLFVGANYVVTVSPGEGTMVPKGTTVTINVV
ncbi:Stk1 family PASTA domain-containing Ser/Thr kinase [Nocardioides marmorisolisilvae]|uniref:Stk1 family PASTA domain-containing Ser/Thr kinase n=1 Tax=Nocardioides marmorisolisilvae TaxID=1542737 RepID=UPI001FE50FA2|nr:Stk1 family PASTA domain-containing Ser/Thr kinase [Nocardioides marmorisolisilvae]